MSIEYEEIDSIYLRNEPIYEIIRKCNDDILIVEIFSKEYESNDFVLFYFSDSVVSANNFLPETSERICIWEIAIRFNFIKRSA